MKITVCDWRDNKGEPCGERADMTVTFTQDGKRYEADLCSQLHGKQLAANAREAESSALPAGYNSVTKLPRSEGRTPQVQPVGKADYQDLRSWLEAEQLLPQNSRGRIKNDLQERWLEAGSPRQRADGTFQTSG